MSFCSASFGQVVIDSGFQEVTSPNVKILGKGLVNRETDEVIAYACVGMDEKIACDDLQMIYFNPRDQKSYLFGRTVHLDAENKKELHRFFKKAKKGYYDANPTLITRASLGIKKWAHDSPAAIPLIGAGGIVVSGAVIPALLAAGVAVEMLFPVSLAIVGATYIAVRLTTKVRVNPLSSTTFQSFHDTRNWNWSISHKKLSSKKFEKVFSFLRTADLTQLP